MAVFGEAVARLQQEGVASNWCCRPCRICRRRSWTRRSWPVQPQVVIGEQEKRAAFRIAHAALAKSGTVTLELALQGCRWCGLPDRLGGGLDLRRAIKVNR